MASVLVVDEHPAAEPVVAGLGVLGHTVTRAPDAATAIALLADGAFDVLLLGRSMADLSAGEAMREIERRSLRDRAKIVLLGLRLSEADILTAYQAGFDHVMTIPPSATELDEAVTTVLTSTPEALELARQEEMRRSRLLSVLEEDDDL